MLALTEGTELRRTATLGAADARGADAAAAMLEKWRRCRDAQTSTSHAL
jgi:hypothetical protein